MIDECGVCGGNNFLSYRADVDFDQLINILDLISILNHIVYGNPFSAAADDGLGDVNCDGYVNVFDTVLIVQFIIESD